MKMLLLKTTGEAVEVAAELAAEVERLIGAELLDVVDLRGGRVAGIVHIHSGMCPQNFE